MSKLFSCDHLAIRWTAAGEEKNQVKNDEF